MRYIAFRHNTLAFLPVPFHPGGTVILALGLAALPAGQAVFDDDAPLHGVDDGRDIFIGEVEGSSGFLVAKT